MNSCRKGADGERELAALLREEGYTIERGGTQSYGAVPDLSGPVPLGDFADYGRR